MSGRLLGLALLFALLGGSPAGRAHAADLELTLSRLSVGDCASTLGGTPLVLQQGEAPTLRPDTDAFAQLAAQLASVIAPTVLAPVVTSGPRGLDVSVEQTTTRLDDRGDLWRRARVGSAGTPMTCEGRSRSVPSLVHTQRLRFVKGLPYGFSLGAMVGLVQAASAWLIGADLKFALLEQLFRARLPDLALRLAATHWVGGDALSLTVGTLSVVLSKSFVVRRSFALAPFVSGEAMWTRAESNLVDLTPNIDALACRADEDPLCRAAGLGGSGEDLAHDVRFRAITQLRYRAHAGLSLRVRRFMVTGALAVDLSSTSSGAASTREAPARQWTVSVAPSFSF